MKQSVTVLGMVLSSMPIGEYDRRLTILTRERGKITVFARGARKPDSPFLAAANPCSFGEFELREGREAYSLVRAGIREYFTDLAKDFETACYGFYFLEIASYYAQENNDERELLRLLYQSLRALCKESLDNRLVRRVFEWKSLVINGEYPQVYGCALCQGNEGLEYFSTQRAGCICRSCAGEERGFLPVSASTLYTMQFITSSDIETLYTFAVSEEVLEQLGRILDAYMQCYIGKTFKSLRPLA